MSSDSTCYILGSVLFGPLNYIYIGDQRPTVLNHDSLKQVLVEDFSDFLLGLG